MQNEYSLHLTPKTKHLSFHTGTWKWLGSLVVFFFPFLSWFPPSAALRLKSDPEMSPTMRVSQPEHFRTNSVFFDSVDDNQTFLLLLFFRWISRKCLLVGYLCVHESGLLWCLLDASWCNMKNKEKSSFFFCCKYNLFSCGCPGPSLPSCDWTKVKSSRLLFRHCGRVPHSRFTAVTVEVKGKVWLEAV